MSRTASVEPAAVGWHKCDACKHETYVVYIPQLDKWYCVDCIDVACRILRKK